MAYSSSSSGAIVAEALVLNLTPPSKIGTGICFLDHMVDQLTSHAQLGVTLRCGLGAATSAEGGAAAPEVSPTSGSKRSAPEAATRFFAPLRDYAATLPAGSGRPHDRDIFAACGAALGAALRRVVDEVGAAAGAEARSVGRSSAVFCCPLDEAFAEAILDLRPPPERRGACHAALEPYGVFAGRAAGREWVGRYRTELTPVFWGALASALGADLSLRRVRGGNAHHVLESTFKAFARAFRAALDKLADGGSHGCATADEGAPPPPVPPAAGSGGSAAAAPRPRRAERKRATKETTIEVAVDLDAGWKAEDGPTGAGAAWAGGVMTASTLRGSVESLARVSTGVPTLDRVLIALARRADIALVVRCEGDRYIDDHHTAEDVAITLGQCLHEALGDKAGLARMGCAEGRHGGAAVRAIIDLSNRPHFESDLPLDEEYVGGGDGDGDGAGGEHGGGGDGDGFVCGTLLSCEMLFHVFNSLTLETRATGHLETRADAAAGRDGHTLDLALAAASAYGAALARAIRVDPRRRGAVASSKGTLSA